MTPSQGIAYLQNMPENEPVFILRARDKMAPSAIVSWAMLVSGTVTLNTNEELAKLVYDKARKAMDIAIDFTAYQLANGSKIPD